MAIPGLLIKMFGMNMARKLVTVDSKLEASIRAGGVAAIRDIDCDAKAEALALALVDMVRDGILEDRLGLTPKAPFTKYVFGKKGPAMHDTGELLTHLHIQKSSKCTYRVYWDDKPLQHDMNMMGNSGKNISWNAKSFTG